MQNNLSGTFEAKCREEKKKTHEKKLFQCRFSQEVVKKFSNRSSNRQEGNRFENDESNFSFKLNMLMLHICWHVCYKN